MTRDRPAPRAHTLRTHLRETTRLAVPVMLARLGVLTIVTMDTAMSGHASGDDLAWYSVAIAPQIPLLLVGIGLLMGTIVMTAQAVGAGRTERCGAIWRTALVHAAVAGAVMGLACGFGKAFLLTTGQPEDIAAGGGRVLTALGFGLPAMLLYVATSFFLEGIGRPVPGMVIIIAANVLNVVLNWFLIFGHGGLPALGAEGAAIATSIVRWCMFAAAALYVLRFVNRRRFGIGAAADPVERLGPRLRRIGLPMGIAHGLEASAFAAMTLIAGSLGAVAVGGYSIPMNLLALAFMGAIGLSTSASVRVGNAVGRGDSAGVRWAGWVAVGVAVVYLALIAMVFGLVPEPLAGLYTTDAMVIAIAGPTIVVAAVAAIPDGVQGVLMGALRGASDVWPATFLYVFSFWVVMVPLGYWLAVPRGMGAPGLMTAVVVGATVAALLLGWRFRVVSARSVRQA
ncbi:MAG: MATE family efflux transporter [Thiotrichales bacterium]|nr:MATE family efflux transporter [Thiotrichales bacterium]